ADHDRRAEREDAGKGNVEVRQDAQRRGLDDVPAKACEIAGARAAGIDKGRGAAGPRDLGRIDPERSAAPVDMRMQVDQPWRDDPAAHIDYLGAPTRQIGPDRSDLAIG